MALRITFSTARRNSAGSPARMAAFFSVVWTCSRPPLPLRGYRGAAGPAFATRDRLRRALPEAARLPASSGGRPPRWNWPCSAIFSPPRPSCANSTVKPSRWRNWSRSPASSTSSSISRIRNRQPLFANLARHRRIHTLLYTHLHVAARRFKALVRLACRGDTAAKDWVAVPFHVFLECSETP